MECSANRAAAAVVVVVVVVQMFLPKLITNN
jgi:hypothetical protein